MPISNNWFHLSFLRNAGEPNVRKTLRAKKGRMKQFEDNNQAIESFANNILILCPKCNKTGIVKSDNNIIKLFCTNCGLTKLREGNRSQILNTDSMSKIKGTENIIVFGVPVDPYFKSELYLKIDCCKSVLYAFNKEHLQYIKDFVEAEIRERSADKEATIRNRTMISRLPKWMKISKNRNEILKKINTLEKKIKDSF